MDNLFKILLVEDNELDAEKFFKIAKKINLPNPIIWAKDGIEALEILETENENKLDFNPFLIVLDLNMPRMDGFEFLKELQNINKHKDSPVIILTTSDQKEEIDRAYELNISAFVVKPESLSKMNTFLTSLSSFWHYNKFRSFN